MFNEDIKNRMDVMFPQIHNKITDITNENTVATEELWTGLSDKFGDKVKKILAPLDGIVMDVKTDIQVTNPDACPVVQVEVIDSMGSALVDTADWDSTNVQTHYEDVKLHRISRPFYLTAYDLQRGERVETKITAAAEVVAQGVIAQFNSALSSVQATTLSEFGPEQAAEISGAFENDETNALILSPAQYAKLVPTSSLGLNPAVDGTYGINKILKGTGVGDAVALTKDAVAGAIATPAVLVNHGGNGMDIRVIGSIAGFPLVLKTQYDWNETLKCSVECMAGFTIANANGVKKYTIS